MTTPPACGLTRCVTHTAAEGHNAALLAVLQQRLVDVGARLRAVDAEVGAAREAGDAEEVSALRSERALLLDSERRVLEAWGLATQRLRPLGTGAYTHNVTDCRVSLAP